MKTRNWFWLLFATMVCTFYACGNEDVGYESSPDWAIEGGYKVLESIDGVLTQDAAWELVKEKMLNGKTEGMAVYISSEVVSPYTTYVKMSGELTTPSYSCWLIFIDDEPYQSWVHNCRYVFVKTDGSIIKVEKDNTPINNLNDKFTHLFTNLSSEVLSSRVSNSFTGNMNIVQTNSVSSNRYAVIISGGWDHNNNHYRYWNNSSAIYNVLKKKYGYPTDNIKTFISDGYNLGADRRFYNTTTEWFESSPTDLDQDGINDVTGAATLSNIRSAFTYLRNTLTPADELFIFITSHGGYDGAYYTTLWGEKLYAAELQSMLSRINTDNIQIISTVCNSGGFIPALESHNRVIGTACRADENSWAYNTLEFDAFPYYWISGMLGLEIDDLDASVNCDLDDDSEISFYEAFQYAKDNAETLNEHAQYLSLPNKLGNSVGLGNVWFRGKLIGEQHFCNQAIYYVENLPSTANIEWNVTSSEFSTTNNEWTSSNTIAHSTTLTLTNYYYQRPHYYSIKAVVTENDKEREFELSATSNEYAPYMGTLVWFCGIKTGQSNYSFNQDYVEFELEQTHEFYASSYTDILNRVHSNPNIYDVTSPDLSASTTNSMAEITPMCSGEGNMEVYLYGCSSESIPFVVPYIVFDPNSYSLQLNRNISTLNIASQTATYGVRNENPIRTIEVRTYDRQTLLTFNVEKEQTNVTDIDISTLSPGTYILKVTDDTVHYLKLVI